MRSWLLLSAVLVAAPAAARAAVTSPAPGIAHRSETRDGQRWHAVTVTLGHPGVAVHVSSEASKGRTLSQIARAEGATVAVNAKLDRPGFSLCGTAFSRGIAWRAVDSTTCAHGFAWGRQPSSYQLLSTKDLVALPPGLTDAVSGYPTLVKGGVPCDGQAPASCAIPAAAPAAFVGPNPRTMLGVDKDRTRLLLVVADGRESGAAAGMTLAEAARFLRVELGAWDAVNLDGGGSSELWIGAEGGVVNAPSDGAERPIANAVVVRFDPTNAPASTEGHAREPPAIAERETGDRRRAAATVPLVIALALGGLGLWVWSKSSR